MVFPSVDNRAKGSHKIFTSLIKHLAILKWSNLESSQTTTKQSASSASLDFIFVNLLSFDSVRPSFANWRNFASESSMEMTAIAIFNSVSLTTTLLPSFKGDNSMLYFNILHVKLLPALIWIALTKIFLELFCLKSKVACSGLNPQTFRCANFH